MVSVWPSLMTALVSVIDSVVGALMRGAALAVPVAVSVAAAVIAVPASARVSNVRMLLLLNRAHVINARGFSTDSAHLPEFVTTV